jgi:hypothetical protein
MGGFPRNMVIDTSEISQTIDESWIGAKVDDPVLLEKIGQATLDYMLNRVSKGKGIGGVTFNPNRYSKKYINSAEFQAAGKKPSPVNMMLHGDMLGSIEVLVEGSSVKLVIPPDQSPKAHGHQTGDGTAPKRPFFGVTREEFEKNILSKFKDEIRSQARPKSESQTNVTNRRSKTNKLLESLGIIEQIENLGDLFRLIK